MGLLDFLAVPFADSIHKELEEAPTSYFCSLKITVKCELWPSILFVQFSNAGSVVLLADSRYCCVLKGTMISSTIPKFFFFFDKLMLEYVQGIYLASVTKSGCLTVHDFESLYCTTYGPSSSKDHWNPT